MERQQNKYLCICVYIYVNVINFIGRSEFFSYQMVPSD